MRLFCYGTLQFPEVMRAVCGYRLRGSPAVLEGYACHTIKGQVFPGIIQSGGCRTKGLLYSTVGPVQLRRLDRFETGLYQRVCVCVTDTAGRSLPAWTYVIPLATRGVLSAEDWSRERFAGESLAAFVHVCRSRRAWG